MLSDKIVSVCADVKSAHSRIDHSVSMKLFTWIVSSICAAFVLALSILIYQYAEQTRLTMSQFTEQQALINRVDGKLNVLVFQVGQIEKRSENKE